MKVWLLTNTPSPYQIELFRAIHRSGQLALDVRFMRLTHRGRSILPTGFPHRELQGIGWQRDEFRIHPRALIEVKKHQYDFYILSGHYTSPTFLLCAHQLNCTGSKWAVWLEQPWPEDYRPQWATRAVAKSSIARTLRRNILEWLLQSAPAGFCIGTAAMEAYGRLGAAPAKLKLMPYYCDANRFGRPNARTVSTLRSKHKLEGKITFLFSGQLIERKGVDILTDAFCKLARQLPDVALLILGDGPERAQLESRLSNDPYREMIHFVGHVEQETLPDYFASADIFVFPSRHDGWGVVINEACGAGLPVISTKTTGAARDLVVENENGFLTERDDIEGLVNRMKWFVDNPEGIKAMGARSLEIAKRSSLENGVRQFIQNVETTCAFSKS